jgi:hypothetical protein
MTDVSNPPSSDESLAAIAESCAALADQLEQLVTGLRQALERWATEIGPT